MHSLLGSVQYQKVLMGNSFSYLCNLIRVLQIFTLSDAIKLHVAINMRISQLNGNNKQAGLKFFTSEFTVSRDRAVSTLPQWNTGRLLLVYEPTLYRTQTMIFVIWARVSAPQSVIWRMSENIGTSVMRHQRATKRGPSKDLKHWNFTNVARYTIS